MQSINSAANSSEQLAGNLPSSIRSANQLTDSDKNTTPFPPSERRHWALKELRDPCLLRQWGYIDGKWQQSRDAGVLEVFNPADGLPVGTVQRFGRAETRDAINAAGKAIEIWKRKLPQERAVLLREWGRMMLEHQEDLALIMTIEQGKPLVDSRGEIAYAAEFFEWFAEEARRINGETIGGHLANRQMQVLHHPVGVTAAVTPWNFPAAMITRKAGAALAAGCTMVVRPASETPFSALALAELADRVGIPPGVFSVLPGSRDIVDEMCTNQKIRAISFTGSTGIGKLLLSKASSSVKRMALELGGHAPFIVFPDVDLDEAVDAAVKAKFQTSGQDCLAANRIYVHRDVYSQFCTKFAEKTTALKVGNGLDQDVEIGPLMNEKAVQKCRDHVQDAIDKGASLLTGGTTHSAGSLFFTPTVLADVEPDMDIYRDETFGPVAPLLSFKDEQELIAKINHPELGLIAYLFTHNHDRICRLSNVLEYGMVAVNCVKVTGGPIPFGGVKQSGLGREGGHWGIEEFLDTKYICAAYKAL